ncbi:hypothetical protein [Streptomyces albus]|uniref:hypothetical protein n=1 Tax=Streptomyces albus TaxID=1888 RepID=UPI0006E3B0E7|nr:hypothetical protein [Streptomyces albus]
MPRKGQRSPIDPTFPPEKRRYVQQLRTLVDVTGLSGDDFVAEAQYPFQAPTLTKLLAGDVLNWGHSEKILETSERLIGRRLIEAAALRNLHEAAVFSTKEGHLKEKRRCERAQRQSQEDRKHLPVPRSGGDRQVNDPETTQAERFLARLLRNEDASAHVTVEVLNAGADVLPPYEAATVMARLQHHRRYGLADDFAQIYGREQASASVVHAARDLIDSHSMPNLASRLLTAAIYPAAVKAGTG